MQTKIEKYCRYFRYRRYFEIRNIDIV